MRYEIARCNCMLLSAVREEVREQAQQAEEEFTR